MGTRYSEPKCRCRDGWVYTPYITKNGVRIMHPRGGVFKFPCTCNSK